MSTIRVEASSPELVRTASDDGNYLRLGLWYPNEAFRHVLEACLDEIDPPCLVMVMRTDMPLVPDFAARIEKNFDFLATHPLVQRFAVSTPGEAEAAVLGNRDRTTHVDCKSEPRTAVEAIAR